VSRRGWLTESSIGEAGNLARTGGIATRRQASWVQEWLQLGLQRLSIPIHKVQFPLQPSLESVQIGGQVGAAALLTLAPPVASLAPDILLTGRRCTTPMPSDPRRGTVTLRPTTPSDAPALFRMESDPVARHMAAFGGEEPATLAPYQARWERMLADKAVTSRTVLWNGQVAGYVVQFELFGQPSVAVWIDRELWGRGIATRALSLFVAETPMRPLFARVAKDNVGSRTVVERCGFKVIGEDTGFARNRGTELTELIYRLGE